MKDFEIIIKDKEGNKIDTSIKSLDINDNEIKIISFVCSDKEIGSKLATLLSERFKELGLKKFLVMPIMNKDYEISIKTIKIDE